VRRASTELRPSKTKSTCPATRNAAARARAVARVSEPANPGSTTWAPSSARQAIPRAVHLQPRVGGGDHHAAASELAGDCDALALRSPTVRVHLERDRVAPKPPVATQLQCVHLRHLCDQDGYVHRFSAFVVPARVVGPGHHRCTPWAAGISSHGPGWVIGCPRRLPRSPPRRQSLQRWPKGRAGEMPSAAETSR
jgi:hypothetical protein